MNKCTKLKFIFLFLLFMFVLPQAVLAHATLERATPAPDSHLEVSPPEIVLRFNERIEKELYSIKVLNTKGKTVDPSETQISQDQHELSQDLPNLSNGIYTVTYSILSVDGHPVRGSYVFSVGETSDKSGSTFPRNDLHEEHGMGDPVSTYIIRALYYFTLLLLSGWVAWGILYRLDPDPLKRSLRQSLVYLQQAFLIMNFGMGLLQFLDMLNGWNTKGLLSLLTGTVPGISWLISMSLSIGGFFFLHRMKWIDGLWVLVLLTTESVNGHAMAMDPPIGSVLLDMFHLLAAALWVAGLVYIVIFWRNNRDHVLQFLPVFSKVALLCILILMVTGTFSTFIFLPSIRYLLYTPWGILLISKVILVMLVMMVGGAIRWMMKRKRQNAVKRLIKMDFSLMIVVVMIVGTLTHLSPTPQNKPLSWHQNTKNVEFITTISPNSPGNNMIMIEATSRHEGLAIKRIELYLKYNDNPDVAPIHVPLTESKPAMKVQGMQEGPYLPFPGHWTAEVRILDSNDDESVYSKDFIIF